MMPATKSKLPRLTPRRRKLAESCWALACLLAIRRGARPREVLDSWQFGVCCEGLTKAAALFDFARGKKFTTFATVCIRSAFTHVYMGRAQAKRGGTGTRGKVQFAPIRTVSTEAIGHGDDAWDLADYRRPPPPAAAESRERGLYAMSLLRKLRAKERRMVRRHVMLGWTFEEVGKAETPPVTRERVRQIVERALERLRADHGEKVGECVK